MLALYSSDDDADDDDDDDGAEDLLAEMPRWAHAAGCGRAGE